MCSCSVVMAEAFAVKKEAGRSHSSVKEGSGGKPGGGWTWRMWCSLVSDWRCFAAKGEVPQLCSWVSVANPVNVFCFIIHDEDIVFAEEGIVAVVAELAYGD